MNNKYEILLLKQFLSEYNLKKEDIKNPHNLFRFICYRFIGFMKPLLLPDISKNSLFEAVLVEFRKLPHLEFIIRNAIYKLGKKWSFTVICGKENQEMMEQICKSISNKIRIIVLPYNNISQQEYSNLLITSDFWELLNGDKILIYQEDTIIFGDNIIPFLDYDFIGAPFNKNSDDTPNKVGNGGLSLRSKPKMLEVIKTCNINNLNINSSTMNYMKYRGLQNPPEDIYFSKNLQELNIGEVASWNTASMFASETVFNPKSWGAHKIWSGTNNWKSHIKQRFGFKPYISKSNLDLYLSWRKKPQTFNKTKEIKNAFDIDLVFYAKVNNILFTSLDDILSHVFKVSLDGYIYHPKQILNFFPNCKFYEFMNNLFIQYDENIWTVQDFTFKFLYNSTFKLIADISIVEKYDVLNNNYDILLLVFIGNETIGIELIKKIINYKKHQSKFNVAFCLNSNLTKSDKLKSIIKSNFDFYAIYLCNEFGNDIIPTLLMYDCIIKNHKFTHIIKLHTKSISSLFHSLTDYLLTQPINTLIKSVNVNCNCIGTTYSDLTSDNFNLDSIKKYEKFINMDYSFVAGTIFYTQGVIMDKLLILVKNTNYRSFLLNNLYENNSINRHYSPVHFIERLFGIINLSTIP
jgi:hypothetical protein